MPLFHYNKLSKQDPHCDDLNDNDDETAHSPLHHSARKSPTTHSITHSLTNTHRGFIHKYVNFNTVLLLLLASGLVLQAVQLHRSDEKFSSDLARLKYSLQEDITRQKLSENTSNAHVLVEVSSVKVEVEVEVEVGSHV
jgi:hypothetical protein